MLDIEDSMLKQLESADYEGFVKIGAEYADAVISGDSEYNESMKALMLNLEKTTKVNSFEGQDDYLEAHYNLYTGLAN